MSKLNRVLLIIVVILASITALVWFKPDILSSLSLSTLNPFSKEKSLPVTSSTTTATLPSTERITTIPKTIATPNNTEENSNLEEEKEELTPFEKEIKQRHESYQTKIYTYEPYEPPILRNPFQRVVSTVYVGDEKAEQLAKELETAEDIRRFVQPELPPGTNFTGLISSGDNILAIIEMDDETYIVKKGDLILDKYLVKSIQNDKVMIEINGYEISLKLGGEEDSND